MPSLSQSHRLRSRAKLAAATWGAGGVALFCRGGHWRDGVVVGSQVHDTFFYLPVFCVLCLFVRVSPRTPQASMMQITVQNIRELVATLATQASRLCPSVFPFFCCVLAAEEPFCLYHLLLAWLYLFYTHMESANPQALDYGGMANPQALNYRCLQVMHSAKPPEPYEDMHLSCATSETNASNLCKKTKPAHLVCSKQRLPSSHQYPQQ